MLTELDDEQDLLLVVLPKRVLPLVNAALAPGGAVLASGGPRPNVDRTYVTSSDVLRANIRANRRRVITSGCFGLFNLLIVAMCVWLGDMQFLAGVASMIAASETGRVIQATFEMRKQRKLLEGLIKMEVQ